jgi:hypothetical protein
VAALCESSTAGAVQVTVRPPPERSESAGAAGVFGANVDVGDVTVVPDTLVDVFAKSGTVDGVGRAG